MNGAHRLQGPLGLISNPNKSNIYLMITLIFNDKSNIYLMITLIDVGWVEAGRASWVLVQRYGANGG